MSKSTGTERDKTPIRRSIISETTRNIDSIANAINEGRYADKELMVKLINRMLAFLNEFVKPKQEVQDGKGINGDGTPSEENGASTPTGTETDNTNA
jgi:hypothetical protein